MYRYALRPYVLYLYKFLAMKQIVIAFFALVLLASCNRITGSGNIVTEKRSVGNFKGLSVSNGLDVEVKQGSTMEVLVEADDNVISHIETTVSGGVLKIRTEGLNNLRNVHMKIYVTAPVLNSLRASSGSTIDVTGDIRSDEKVDIHASSAADINAGIIAPSVDADASSGSSINLNGKTRDLLVEASSGSNVKCWDLLSETCKASASSGSEIEVHASVKLNASASSGSSVNYRGGANVNKAESSGGSVSKN